MQYSAVECVVVQCIVQFIHTTYIVIIALIIYCILPEGRMLVPIPGQVVPVAPAPMPAGVSYADKQQQGGATMQTGQQGAQYGYDGTAPQVSDTVWLFP